MTLAQNENELIKIIKEAYAKGDVDTVIDRVKISFECFLQCGITVGGLSRQLIDVGVRERELAIGLIEGIIKVPDEKLSKLDREIKQKSLQTKGKMLLTLFEQAVKEKKL